MRNLSMREPYDPIDDHDILTLESQLGITFPLEYKDFLRKTNGGYLEPDNDCYYDVVGEIDQKPVQIDDFYGINSKDRASNILKILEIFSGRIPDDLLPVGSDPFGNQICLGVCGKRFGKVYFWIHDEEGDDEYDSLVYHIANDFAQLINGLTSYKEE